jgi:hypothetical protein
MVADFTIDTDLAEIQEAEKIAKALRSFQGRVDLDVEGREELADALDLAEKMDQIRSVKVQVQGLQDLERAGQLADDLERRRTIPIDAQASDLVRLEDEITEAGEGGAEGIAGAIGDVDFEGIGAAGLDALTGALATAGPWAAVAGAAGAAFGGEFLEGFSNALPTGRADTIRALRTNLSGSEMREVGTAGGEAYSAGLTEGLTEAKDAAATLRGELGDVDEDLDLGEVTRQASALAAVFDVDIADAVTGVRNLVAQGLVRDSEEGFNLLFELAQRTGVQFDEMLESSDEFSTAIKALGIEGAHGLGLIAEMIEQKIFPQVDQAGEVFEELNETIITGGAAEALEQIGLNAEEMQQRIAAGGPDAARAVAEISERLLAIDDDALQASATAEIFGGNMALLGDEAREAALELFATADGTTAVGTAASDAADAIEESATGLDRLKRAAIDAGEAIGTPLADALAVADALEAGDWDGVAQGLQDVGQGFGDLIPGIKGSGDEAEAAAPKLMSTSDELRAMKGEAIGAADGLDETEGAVSSLDDALAEFSGRFDADELFIDLEEQIARTVATATEAEGSFLNLDGSFNLLDDTGRELNQTFIDLAREQDGLITGLQDGTISAGEYQAGMGRVRQGVIDARMAMGDGRAEAERYADKLLAIPDDISPDVRATSNVPAVVDRAERDLNRLDGKTATTYIVTRTSTISGKGTGTISKRAHGGPVTAGDPFLVGEEGEELFVPGEDGTIIDAGQTRAMRSAPTGPAAAGLTVNVAVHGSLLTERSLEEIIADAVRRGGLR